MTLALHEAGLGVLGIDISEARLAGIRAGAVDLLERDRARLVHALDSGRFGWSADPSALGGADAVISPSRPPSTSAGSPTCARSSPRAPRSRTMRGQGRRSC